MKKPPVVTLEEQFAKTKPGDAGILGDPVAHSLSPAMQNAAFHVWWNESAPHLDAAPVYHRFHVKPDQLKEAVFLARQHKLRGVNVTVPHKSAVLEYVDKMDGFAKKVEAVNTLVFAADGVHGHNTDAEGFRLSVQKDLEFKAHGKTALVLGAGATGRVITYELFEMGVSRVYFWNRNPKRVLGVVHDDGSPHKNLFQIDSPRDLEKKATESDLVVNATSVGLSEKDGMPADGLRFKKGQFVFDVIYHRDTLFMQNARKAGAAVTGGFGMLLYQGAKAFEIWTGAPAPVNEMRGALMHSLKEV